MFTDYRIKVPGKVIITGEHSVVMGAPALAAACTLYVENRIRENSSGEILITSREKENTTPLYRTAERFTEKYGIKKGADMEISSSVPTGSGMGSSAAAITSVLTGLCVINGIKLPAQEMISMARECENIIHGTSSGLDPATVITGGLVKMINREFIPCPVFENLDFMIINTGRPESTTGETVAHTKELFAENPHLLDEFTRISVSVEKALCDGNRKLLLESITENQMLLEKIGVVPEKTAAFARKAENLGTAFKISGAGSIRGDNSGIGLVFGADGDRALQIENLCREYGYSLSPAGIHQGGIECLL